jgi:hypothetical protein
MMSQKTTVLFAALLCSMTICGQKPLIESFGLSIRDEYEGFDQVSEDWYQNRVFEEFDFGDADFLPLFSSTSRWRSTDYAFFLSLDLLPDRWERATLYVEPSLGYFEQAGHSVGNFVNAQEMVDGGMQSIQEHNSIWTSQKGVSLSTQTLYSLDWKRFSVAAGAGVRVGQTVWAETTRWWLRTEEFTDSTQTSRLTFNDTLVVNQSRLATTGAVYLPFRISARFQDRFELRWECRVGIGHEFQQGGDNRALRSYWSTGFVLAAYIDPHFTRSDRLKRKG